MKLFPTQRGGAHSIFPNKAALGVKDVPLRHWFYWAADPTGSEWKHPPNKFRCTVNKETLLG